MRVGILASHPIQYNTPLFRALAKRMDLRVYYAHRQTPAQQAAAGFGKQFEWDVDLISGYSSEFLRNTAKDPSVDRFSGCNCPEIASKIQAERFDAFVVYGWNLLCYWQAISACRTAGIPIFVRGDSHLDTPRTLLRRVVKEILYRPLLRVFSGFFVVGARNREYLRHYSIPERLLFEVPHYVDNDWFRTRSEEARLARPSLREHIGADSQTAIVLFVGKFIPVKRPVDLITAGQLLHARGERFVVVYVVDGPLAGELREAASHAPFPVHFAGFRNQSELPAWYAMADVLALPSQSETWGLVVNEAMACGLATVVSSSVGCAPDLIEEGRTGAVFPVGDVHAFSEALSRAIRLSKRPETSFELRERLSRYSVEAAAAGVESALERVLRSRTMRVSSADAMSTGESRAVGS